MDRVSTRLRATRLSFLSSVLSAMLGLALLPRLYFGSGAKDWFEDDPDVSLALARALVDFENSDDAKVAKKDRFEGEWALVTHQMAALGFAQLLASHPEEESRLTDPLARAATKTFLPSMRDFGTEAWGEDGFATLGGDHGHAYLAYSALAVGMARVSGAHLSEAALAAHDSLIEAYERRLSASKTGLIETYPGEAYPTDVAAVAAAIAVHGRATGRDHRAVLEHWSKAVRRYQIHPESGLVIQRIGVDGVPHDAPRGSGTGLAAYFASFADEKLAEELANATLRHEASFLGFGGITEYAEGYEGEGDIDSGPVLLGVSVSASGFGLACARISANLSSFERLYRTASFFGFPNRSGDRFRFATGGPIGNALLLAFLTVKKGGQ